MFRAQQVGLSIGRERLSLQAFCVCCGAGSILVRKPVLGRHFALDGRLGTSVLGRGNWRRLCQLGLCWVRNSSDGTV